MTKPRETKAQKLQRLAQEEAYEKYCKREQELGGLRARINKLVKSTTPVTGVICGSHAPWVLAEEPTVDLSYEAAWTEAYSDKYGELLEIENENSSNTDINEAVAHEYAEAYMSNDWEYNGDSITYLYGDWKKDADDNAKYVPDENGAFGFSAIYDSNDNYMQVVWSRYMMACNKCSPCFPGQGDLDTNGLDYIAYMLPPTMVEFDFIQAHSDYFIITPGKDDKDCDRMMLAEKPYSNHPDDRNLWVVLAMRKRGDSIDYVTWERNNGDKPKNMDNDFYNCFYGHYDMLDFMRAWDDYVSRFHDCKR